MPPTPGQPAKQPMVLPLRVAAHDRAANALGEERLVLLTDGAAAVPLGRFTAPPILSFNRGFSAPIVAEVARGRGDLAWLSAHDSDPFARYEALQALMLETLVARVSGGAADDAAVVDAVGATLAGWRDDPAFVAEACVLPSEAFIGDAMLVVDPDAIRRERRALQRALARAHDGLLRTVYAASETQANDLSPTAKGLRKLRALALMLLWAGDAADAPALALRQYREAGGMTDRQGALAVLAHSDAPERAVALADFHARYANDALVLDKWFSVQAFSLRSDTPEQVAALAQHADFTLANPNRVRALYGAFAGNQGSFHAVGGAGYALLTDLIIALDPKNPQTAARMVPPLGRWRRFDATRAALMRDCLERILATPGLSRDTAEQASKSLAG